MDITESEYYNQFGGDGVEEPEEPEKQHNMYSYLVNFVHQHRMLIAAVLIGIIIINHDYITHLLNELNQVFNSDGEAVPVSDRSSAPKLVEVSTVEGESPLGGGELNMDLFSSTSGFE